MVIMNVQQGDAHAQADARHEALFAGLLVASHTHLRSQKQPELTSRPCGATYGPWRRIGRRPYQTPSLA